MDGMEKGLATVWTDIDGKDSLPCQNLQWKGTKDSKCVNSNSIRICSLNTDAEVKAARRDEDDKYEVYLQAQAVITPRRIEVSGSRVPDFVQGMYHIVSDRAANDQPL